MKEILQTKRLSNKHQYCAWSICICIIHVEHVDKEYVAGVETEVEVQDPEGQFPEEPYVGADQEPEPEQDLTNTDNTQGKHRFMINPAPFQLGLTITTSTYALSL